MLQAVYQLREDKQHVALVQDATLNSDWAGIQPTHGLFGSDAWWAAISVGDLPMVTLAGKISRIYWGSMGDWPMFDLLSGDGGVTSWTRKCNVGDPSQYKEGRGVELDYVVQRFKPTAPNPNMEHPIVLEIRIGGWSA